MKHWSLPLSSKKQQQQKEGGGECGAEWMTPVEKDQFGTNFPHIISDWAQFEILREGGYACTQGATTTSEWKKWEASTSSLPPLRFSSQKSRKMHI